MTRKRVGGHGDILGTLFHIVNTEQMWMSMLMGKEIRLIDFEQYKSLEKVR
ncbi:hypothetical protein KK120_23105 [Virgibacillus dakarensis]|nr:hypothetical protein [Virgibacillus dakarensis]